MMGMMYYVEEHVGKGVMAKTLQHGILKFNDLLFDELFKGRKTHLC
jgi:hypothetical protein